MTVLASVSTAESILAVGAGLLFAGAYTGLAAFTPHYKKTTRREKITTEVAAGLALVGSLAALVGAFWNAESNVGTVGSVLLALLMLYILCVLAPIIKHIVFRNK